MQAHDTPRGYLNPTTGRVLRLNHPETTHDTGTQPTLQLGDVTDDDAAVFDDALHEDNTPDTTVETVHAEPVKDLREGHSTVGGKTLTLAANTPTMVLAANWFRQALGIRATAPVRIASESALTYGGPLIADGVWEPPVTHTGPVWVLSDLDGTQVTGWEILDV